MRSLTQSLSTRVRAALGRRARRSAAAETGRRDPAPSRLAYRVQRLLLTPLFRRAFLWGAPVIAVVAALALWLGDSHRRANLAEFASSLRRQIEERPEFSIRILAVDGASADLAAEIRAALRLRLPVSSFDLDLPEIRERVAVFDPVASARVFVRPGGVLQVEVDEREPAVVHRAITGLRLLDATGHPVRPLQMRTDRPDLPLVAGAGAEVAVPEALRLADAAAPIAGRVRGYVRVGARRWDVVLDRGQRILLPETGASAALDQAIALDQAQDLLARDVRVLDLRHPRRPTLRLTTEAAETLHQTRAEARRSTSK